MTKDSPSETAALRALLPETSDTHLLAEMLGFVADRLNDRDAFDFIPNPLRKIDWVVCAK